MNFKKRIRLNIIGICLYIVNKTRRNVYLPTGKSAFVVHQASICVVLGYCYYGKRWKEKQGNRFNGGNTCRHMEGLF